jgi:hypothetical protein
MKSAPSVSAAPFTTLTREARCYAIREIARRAGVSEEWLNSWRIETAERTTTVYIGANGNKKIIFPRYSGEDSGNQAKTARAAWAQAPAAATRKLTPDFVVPFAEATVRDKLPVFLTREPDAVEFQFDLPRAAIWTLARVEERTIGERDAHGRFPAAASVAAREGFLDRPIVDEYGFALEQALRHLLPGWSPQREPLSVRLTHDIDEVGIPFSLRSSLGHLLRRGRPRAAFQDLYAGLSNEAPAHLECVLRIASLSSEHRIDSAFYWKASAASVTDSGYDPRHPKIQRVMDWLSEHGFENGVHPGYATFGSRERLRAEVDTLQKCLRQKLLGGRQHYLRWSPETWRDWEDCGLGHDSTVGFAEQVGFRAGTCIPYRPWLFAENREADLIEIPLLVMDRTLAYYMKLTAEHSYEVIRDVLRRCRNVGGVFTMLWHNDALLDPVYGDVYSRTLDELAGSPRFDWRTAHRQMKPAGAPGMISV